ncbi:hypothetical protein ACFFLS_08535 [Flavobacterium procerum]|uniref:DUF3592 domain-containing protein n=1 Tax=Flavobacterium procerum TaxID=1455569 RepID=A0ABV6BNQ6_9FLAO
MKVIIFHFFVLLAFLMFMKRTVGLFYSREKTLGTGVIYDHNTYKRGSNSATTHNYFIIAKDGTKFNDNGNSDTAYYGFRIGDTVVFRKLFNGNTVRMLQRNGKEVRNYYGFVDYASPISALFIILCYTVFPKLLKKLQ